MPDNGFFGLRQETIHFLLTEDFATEEELEIIPPLTYSFHLKFEEL